MIFLENSNYKRLFLSVENFVDNLQNEYDFNEKKRLPLHFKFN